MSDPEIDLNAVIAEVVTNAFRDVASDAAKMPAKTGAAFKRIFTNCFEAYLETAYRRCSKTKTMLYREQAVELREFYVEPSLRTQDDRVVAGNDIDGLLAVAPTILVTGTAGSGKSTFLKHLFLTVFERRSSALPIFLEIRALALAGSGSLLDYLTSVLHRSNHAVTREFVEGSLEKGRLILLLDGYDELDPSARAALDAEILTLPDRFPRASVVITSRPDDTFTSWHGFAEVKMEPFSREQALSLIGRLRYDETVKTRFAEQVKSKLYDQHRDFVTNPLLLTILLLTFEQIAHVPGKMHIFYEQAFETLFHKHDATKELYRRQTATGLPIDDFKRVLAAFCYITYINRRHQFTGEQARQSLCEAAEISGVACDAEKLLQDLVKSVCVMSQDGLLFTFTHRTFQEYFVAVFLSTIESAQRAELLERAVAGSPWEHVLPMLFEMNAPLVEREYVLPQLKALRARAEAVSSGRYRFMRVLEQWFSALVRTPSADGARHAVVAGEAGAFIVQLRALYPTRFAVTWADFAEEPSERLNARLALRPAKQIAFSERRPETADLLTSLGFKRYVEDVLRAAADLSSELERRTEKAETSLRDLLKRGGR